MPFKLCTMREDKLFMCMRDNAPAKGSLFTAGGRVLKEECWSEALNRIARDEIGLQIRDIWPLRMGIWGYFYDNYGCGNDVTTHYVSSPH